MSYTTLYAAFEDGDLVEYGTFKNSHGGAMMIWNAILETYLPCKEGEYAFEKIPMLWEQPEYQKDMPRWEIHVLESTYDKVAVKREDIPKFVEEYRAFRARYRKATRVCSLGEQADAIAKAYDEGCIAIAWNQTSTNGDVHWFIEEEILDDDGDVIDYGEGRPFNVLKDEDFEWLDMS